jgi:hypothetical protein
MGSKAPVCDQPASQHHQRAYRDQRFVTEAVEERDRRNALVGEDLEQRNDAHQDQQAGALHRQLLAGEEDERDQREAEQRGRVRREQGFHA